MNHYLLIAVLLGIATGASGHGETAHKAAHKATHQAAAPVVKEQQEWGIAGTANQVTRTVEVRMTDAMRFSPERLEFSVGETVRIRIRNDGKMLHEFVMGTAAALDEHAALMLRFPTMEHDEPWMAHVPPGQRGEIIWTFNRAGDFAFACLIAGHYQAGMRGPLTVNAKGNRP